jgi:hypothetical protein
VKLGISGVIGFSGNSSDRISSIGGTSRGGISSVSSIRRYDTHLC